MLKLPASIVTSTVDLIASKFDQGDEGAAQIIIWSGDVPASVDDAVTTDNAILATINLPDPAFGPAMVTGSTTEALAAQSATVTASQSGEATFWRGYDRDGALVMQGTVGPTGDTDADLTINQVDILAGANVQITRFVIGMAIA